MADEGLGVRELGKESDKEFVLHGVAGLLDKGAKKHLPDVYVEGYRYFGRQIIEGFRAAFEPGTTSFLYPSGVMFKESEMVRDQLQHLDRLFEIVDERSKMLLLGVGAMAVLGNISSHANEPVKISDKVGKIPGVGEALAGSLRDIAGLLRKHSE